VYKKELKLTAFLTCVVLACIWYSSTKEEVATMVSNYNTCAVCTTAHAMMSAAAVNAERKLKSKKDANSGTPESSDGEVETHDQAIAYAEMVQKATHGKGTLLTGAEAADEFPRLNAKARAEVALVVMLFEHMNRACSSIMGEKMSTAMFGIPGPIAKRIESKRVMGVVNRMMAPMLSGGIQKPKKAGFTKSLFLDEDGESKVPLPSHLEGAETAGSERARAVARLDALMDTLYESRLKDIVTGPVLALLDEETNAPTTEAFQPVLIPSWLKEKVEPIKDEKGQIVATAILMVSVAPRRFHDRVQMKALVKAVGAKEARLVVLWWSVRLSLKRAKGL
jgi:AhpD family alkylhydroperoxidase